MNDIIFKSISGQINIDEAQGIVECFVSGVGNKDSVGDVVLPGAFTASLRRRKPRVVWGHDWNQPIGKVIDIYEVPASDPRLPAKMKQAGIGGLFAKVQFNLKSEKGREAFSNVSFFGEDQEWSIGYKTLDAIYDNERKANLLREVELYEVSPVLHGANQLTGTISIKSDSIDSVVDEELVDEKGEMLRDPKGGLTAAGRAYFNRTQGSNLKPGVMGPADTPEKMRRKGSFLTRFFTSPSGPMKDENGEPTRLALSAAAWGEPVPQNMEDAAELAAKGRRMLDRYQAQKGKNEDVYDVLSRIDAEGEDDDSDYSGPRGPEGGVPAPKPTEGRAGNLAQALSMRFGGAVRLRDADGNMVVFDHMSDEGEKNTFRLTYHFDGDEFMFGKLVKVKPETVYLAIEEEEKSLDAMDEALFELAQLGDSYSQKAGRVISTNNMMKLQQAMALMQEVLATGGRENIEMKEKGALFIAAETSELFSLREFIDPIIVHYGVDVKVLETGLLVESTKSDLETALNTAITNYSSEFQFKNLGRAVGGAVRVSSSGARRFDANARFDPKAQDADADGTVQEGTQFARPAAPAANMAQNVAQVAGGLDSEAKKGIWEKIKGIPKQKPRSESNEMPNLAAEGKKNRISKKLEAWAVGQAYEASQNSVYGDEATAKANSLDPNGVEMRTWKAINKYQKMNDAMEILYARRQDFMDAKEKNGTLTPAQQKELKTLTNHMNTYARSHQKMVRDISQNLPEDIAKDILGDVATPTSISKNWPKPNNYA